MTARAGALALAAVLASFGCAHGRPEIVAAPRGGGWVVVPHVPMVAQAGDADCGPAALTMALARWNAAPAADAWRAHPGEDREHTGFTAGALRDEARRAGFRSFVFEGTFADLSTEIAAGHPVVVGVVRLDGDTRSAHFIVVVGHDAGARHWLVADPSFGVQALASDALREQWARAGWVTLVLAPGGVPS